MFHDLLTKFDADQFDSASARLHMWEVNFEYIVQEISDDEAHATPRDSEYMTSSSPLSSPFDAPRHDALRPRAGCRPDEVQGSSPTNESDRQSPPTKGRRSGSANSINALDAGRHPNCWIIAAVLLIGIVRPKTVGRRLAQFDDFRFLLQAISIRLC
jgi:hypothetical protein